MNSKDKELHLVFIALEKAYDLVDREKALLGLGVDTTLIDAIKSFYKKNKAVRINDTLSEPFYVKRGLRQGCPLSPLLFIATFNIHKDDMPIRPVINLLGSPLETVDMILSFVFRQLIPFINTHLESTSQFVNELNKQFPNSCLPKGVILAKMDVKSM